VFNRCDKSEPAFAQLSLSAIKPAPLVREKLEHTLIVHKGAIAAMFISLSFTIFLVVA
jgi:hypothetical protein